MATCENGKYGGSADIGGHSSMPVERGRLGLTGPPGGEHPAVRRGSPVFGLGAELSAGRGSVNADDSEDEAQRAAGGQGPKSSIWDGRGALTHPIPIG